MSKVRPRPENGALYFDFFYLGKRCREQTTLSDTPRNRANMQKVLDRIDAEISNGTFSYRRHFPNSRIAARLEPVQGATNQSAVVAARSNIASIELPSFNDFATLWAREQSPSWRENTRDWIQSILDTHLLPAFGIWRVDQIKRQHVLEFRATLSERKLKNGRAISPRTINAVMRILKAILAEAALRFGFQNAGEKIKRLKMPRKEINPFSFEEMDLILKTVRKDYHAYLTVAFFTAMRPGELNGLKWEFVDLAKGEIRVRETFTKGRTEYTKTEGSQREIAISPVVREALLAQQKVTGKLGKYVFCLGNGSPIYDRNFTLRVWDPLLRHLELRRRTPYQTRHTCATLWLASGENPEWVARQLGHTTTEMLFRVYSRFIPNLTRQDGSAFERVLADRGFGPAVTPPAASSTGDT